MELRTELYNVRELLLQAADRYNSLADKMEKIEKGFKRIYIYGRMTPFFFLVLPTLGWITSDDQLYHAGWYVCLFGGVLVWGIVIVGVAIKFFEYEIGYRIFDAIRQEIKITTRHLKTNGKRITRTRFPIWNKVWAYFFCPEIGCKKHVWPIFAEDDKSSTHVYDDRTTMSCMINFFIFLYLLFKISKFVGFIVSISSAPFWLFELFVDRKLDFGFLLIIEICYSKEFRNTATVFKRAYPTEQDIEQMVNESQRAYPTEQDIEQMVKESQRAYPTDQDIEQMVKGSQQPSLRIT